MRRASTTARGPSLNPSIDIEDVGFERGAHLLIKHALRGVAPGGRLAVSSRAPDFGVHLLGWCRAQGHRLEMSPQTPGLAWITPGDAHASRWQGAERANAQIGASPQADDVAEHAAPA